MYTQKKEHRLKPGVRRMLFIIPILLIIGGVYCYDKYFKSKGSSGSSLSSSNSGTPSAPVNMDGSTVILKLGGSSTVGDALAPAIVKKFMEQNGYSDVQIASTSKEEKSVIGTKDGKKDRIDIASKGTGKGFKALTANEIDICMASSPAPAGSTYEEHPIGLDGIAIVVNKGSTMQSIGYDEIKNVFSTSSSIYRMDENAGISKVFKEAVMGSSEISKSAKMFPKSAELITALSGDASGIGFLSYTLIGNGNIRALPITVQAGMPGIVPNALTIQSEKYPLCRRLYMYTNHSSNPLTSKIIEFAESIEGQNIVNEIGFVNLNINVNNNSINPIAQPNDPPEYTTLIGNSTKVITEFRFLLNSGSLDSRGVADILRLSQFIGKPENRSKKVILVGFTDNTGNNKANMALSIKRATSVKVLLEASGINVTKVMGFGSARPVRSNATEEDRANNRRVEVWLVN